ncbi:MAG: hypothetical protein P8Y58_09470 [Novosphingobium sp.]
MASPPRITEWLTEVDNIALSSTVASPDTEARYVRAMAVLMRMRPEGLGGASLTAAGEADVMRAVMAGACETAALRLLPYDSQIMTSTSAAGHYLATVRLNGQCRESTSSGGTFALAMISALALSAVEHYHELAGTMPG